MTIAIAAGAALPRRRSVLALAAAGAISACGGGAATAPDRGEVPPAWAIDDGASLTIVPGSTLLIATGAAGMRASVTPALPPALSISISAGGDVLLSCEPGAVIDASGPWRVDLTR